MSIVIIFMVIILFAPFLNTFIFRLACKKKNILAVWRIASCILYGLVIVGAVYHKNYLNINSRLDYIMLIPVFIVAFIYSNFFAKLGFEAAKKIVQGLRPEQSLRERTKA